MKLVIIDYNAGNTASVMYALDRLGAEYLLTDDADEILTADKVIFPGVGEASTTMEFLRKKSLVNIIPKITKPFLGICLGMQLMCKSSEENNADCLGIFNLDVLRFQDSVRVPHMGWNKLINRSSNLFDGISDEDYFYFVHSYYTPLNSFSIADAHYGENFSAALRKDNFFAVQFHPEKSGTAGQKVLKNFIETL